MFCFSWSNDIAERLLCASVENRSNYHSLGSVMNQHLLELERERARERERGGAGFH